QLNAKDKTVLGYRDQLSESDSEVLPSVFDSRLSDGDDNPTNNRFKKDDGYHAFPPPLTGNYMPPLANLSFARLDDSVYRPAANKAIASISKGKPSVIKTSNISVEMPKFDSVRTSRIIIEDWVSDDEDTLVDSQVDSQTTIKSSFKKLEFTKARNESVKSDKQADKPKMVAQNSKADRTDWNVSTIEGNGVTTVKTSAGCVWRTKITDLNNGNPQQALKYKGMFDSRCSRHMTGNKALLTDYQDINGGFGAFGGSTKGGKITGQGPNWLFNIDSLANSMNYQPVTAGNQANINAGHQEVNGDTGLKKNVEIGHTAQEKVSTQQYIVFPLWSSVSSSYKCSDDKARDNKANDATGKEKVQEPLLQEKIARSNSTNNITTLSTPVNTASASRTFIPPHDPLMPELEDTAEIQTTDIFGNAYDEDDLGTNNHSYADESVGVEAGYNNMEPSTIAIGTKWVYQNKKDNRGTVVRNKARLVAQGHTQEEGIDYDESTSRFCGSRISRKKIYKVEKALYGLHQAPRAWYEALSTYLLDNGFHMGQIDKNLFIKRLKVKRIFRYLKGQPKLGLWYLKDSPLTLEAFSNSDYAGASLDRKSTTGGCQYFSSRLISWQCKKQIMVANSNTEAEYIIASHYCGQADYNNMEPFTVVSPIPTTRVHSNHPKAQIIGDQMSAVQTRSTIKKSSGEHAMISYIQKKKRTNHKDFQNCLFACFHSQHEPTKITHALNDENKRGIVVRNKAILVAQGHTQEEGIDYDEVFAPVARVEA
nr:ribonuclease H-like domain, reverse transcriptase, RNA-dependent DNA polymerase [Tanacetum cinerariifolium]